MMNRLTPTRRKVLLSLFLFTLLVPLFLAAFTVRVTGADASIIQGTVVDTSTDQPIVNATVSFWDVSTSKPFLKTSAATGSDGSFRVTLPGDLDYEIYAYHDDPDTPGFDALPILQRLHLDQAATVNIPFRLPPAASIFLEGDILFVDFNVPVRTLRFTVVDPTTGGIPPLGEYIFVYGTAEYYPFLLNPRHVIVPADMTVNINVDAAVYDRGWKNYTFLVDARFHLDHGEAVTVDIRQYSVRHNIHLVNEYLREAEDQLEETERNRFYVVVEKQDLAKARNLITSAHNKLAKQQYEESYVDLIESYILITNVNQAVTTMYLDASASVDALVIFLTLTTLAAAYLIADRGRTKALTAGIFYVVFFAVLYFTYPGFRLVDVPSLVYMMGLSIVLVSVVLYLLPRIFKERLARERIAFRSAVVATFSMAKRNLKRRRLRSLLTIISVTTLIMSFVAFTSFTLGYGLTIQPVFRPPWSSPPASEGLVIRQPVPISLQTLGLTFFALPPDTVDWLHKQPEVTSVAPKVENIPQLSALGNLHSEKSPTPIRINGILGVQPDAEAAITHLDEVVVQGRYLLDNDTSAVLLSLETAASLDVEVGETIVYVDVFSDLQVTIELEVVGLIHGGALGKIVDLDDSVFLPSKLVLTDDDGELVVERCPPSETIVLPWATSLEVVGTGISRFAVQVEDPETLLSLARRIALEKEYSVWGSVGGQLYLARLGSYIEARGLSILIPWGIVISNVLIITVNSIYARRKEVFILSAIGLNPSHITALFAVEAAIVGLIGGGIGYLLGLSSYQAMTVFIGVAVRQKVSALWSFAAMGMAIATVFVGSMFAIKTSVIATPSLLRRWKIEKEPLADEPWTLPMPTKISEDRVDAFLDFIERSLQTYREVDLKIERITRTEKQTPKAVMKSVKFWYRNTVVMSSAFTRNELLLTKFEADDTYTVELRSRGPHKGIYETANLVRRLILSYTTQTK